jgi:hypothetical protein
MRRRHVCAALFVLVVSTGLPTRARSQPDTSEPQQSVRPSDKQLELNNRAVRKIVRGDYAAAVALLEESLTLGKLNVTYLNLGRAYQKLERCEEAERALDRAKTAPAVPEPSPEVIARKIRDYREALSEVCPDIPSPTERARKLMAARARTLGSRMASGAEDVVEASEAEQTGSTAETDSTVSIPPRDEPAPESTTPTRSSRRIWGWSSIGAAGLFGGGSLGLHLLARSQRSQITDTPRNQVVEGVTQREARNIQERANRFDTYSLVAAGVGTAALGTGLYLLLARETPATARTTESTPTVSLHATGTGVSIEVDFR